MSLVNEMKHTRAKECALKIWVGDTLSVAVRVSAMNMAPGSVIESVFVVLGSPSLKYRQYLLAIYT
jgi:hypothetical protein